MPGSSSKADRRSRREWRQRYGLIGTERQTRKPLGLWDRLKFSLLFATLWFAIVWYSMSADPILGFIEAARQQLQLGSGTGRWLVLLLAFEVVRQLSYL